MSVELVVIAPLVPVGLGDEFAGAGTVPLHLTVLPKVRLPADRSADLSAVVDDIAATTAPIAVVADGRAGFGHDGEIPVTTVELSATLRRLHLRLRDDVLRVGAVAAQPAYSGDGYRPHVSDTGDGAKVSPGEQMLLTSLTILDCTLPTRRLVHHAALAGS